MSDSKARKLLGVERVPHLGIRHPVRIWHSLEERAAWYRAEYARRERERREHLARSEAVREARVRAEEAKLQSGGA